MMCMRVLVLATHLQLQPLRAPALGLSACKQPALLQHPTLVSGLVLCRLWSRLVSGLISSRSVMYQIILYCLILLRLVLYRLVSRCSCFASYISVFSP